jgi:hypothetical protein
LLVGRDQYLTDLERTLAVAYTGKPQFVRIVGSAGSGKTAVLDEVCARSAPEVTVLRTRMSGPGTVERYRPVQELVAALVHAQPEPPAGLVSTMRAWCGGKTLDVAGEVLGVVPGLNLLGALYKILVILGRKPSAEQVSRLEHELSDRVGFARDLLLAAAHRPVLLTIDDLQWVDDGTEEVLVETLGRLPKGTARIAFVCAVRHGQADAEPLVRLSAQVDRALVAERRGGARDLPLPALLSSEVNALAADALGHPCDFADEFCGWVCRRTEGNPLRIRGLVATLYDRGLLDARGAVLQSPPFPGGTPPERLELLTAAMQRSDHAAAAELVLLPGPLRRFLEVGATFGTSFPALPVAHIAGLGRAELLEVASSAVSRGLLRDDGHLPTGGAPEGALAFCSATQHAWLVARVPGAVRRQLHADIARWWRPLVEAQRDTIRGLWERPQTEHVEALRGQVAKSLMKQTRALAQHLIGSGLQLEALVEQVRTAETLAATTVLGDAEDPFVAAGDRSTTLDLLEFLDQLGGGPFEAAIADPIADRDQVLAAEQSYHLCNARVWGAVGLSRRAAESARTAVELAEQLGDDQRLRTALLRSVEVAWPGRDLRVFRRDLTRWRELAASAPMEELGAALALAIHWPDTLPTRRTRRWLTERGPEGPDRDEVVSLVLFEELQTVDWTAPLSHRSAAHLAEVLANDGLRSRFGRWVCRTLEGAFDGLEEDLEELEPGYVVHCAAHGVAVLDRCRAALTSEPEAMGLAEDLGLLAFAFVEVARARANPKVLRRLPPEERGEVAGVLAGPALAEREARAAEARGRFLAQAEPNPLSSWFPLVVRSLGVDEVLDRVGPFLRSPYDEARASALQSVLGHPDAAELELDDVLLEATADLRHLGFGGWRRDFGVAVAVALAGRGRPEARPLLASLIVASEGVHQDLADELRVLYRRVLAGERDELLRSPRTTTAPSAVEHPQEPGAAEREARRSRRMADAASDPEVGAAWLRRAAELYERVPDGQARQDEVWEAIAHAWDGVLQAWLDGEEDWSEREAAALDQRVHALREAVALNERLGDHGRVAELQEDLLGTLDLFGEELPVGTLDLAHLASSMVRSALERADLEQALDSFGALLDFDGLEALAMELSVEIRRTAHLVKEPWWVERLPPEDV